MWDKLQETDQATWAGAIATGFAALWVAGTYWYDRITKRREAKAAREISAWKQAMLVSDMLEMARGVLIGMTTVTATPGIHGITPVMFPRWFVPIDDIGQTLTDDPV